MLKKKLAAGILTAALTAVICLGTGTAALAGDDPMDLSSVEGAISKSLVMDEDVTTPNAVFQFKIEKLTENVVDVTGNDVTEYLEKDGPELKISEITYTSSDEGTTSEEGVKTVRKERKITDANGGELKGSTFGHTGVFAYRVTEIAGTYSIEDPDAEKMIYSKAQYTIFITVKNRTSYGGGLKIDSIRGMITHDNAGTDIEDAKVPTTPGSTEVDFQNIYSKTGGSEEGGDGALKISKTVTGKLGDHEKLFDFSLTLHKSATLDMEVAQNGGTYPVYSVELPNGETLEYQFSAEKSEITKTFQLKDGQDITFTDLPVGTNFTLSENGGEKITNYKTTITGMEDGEAFAEAQGAMTTSDRLVGEKSNSADVENNYDDNPITGIVVDNLPFVILICAAVLGFAAYLMVKRRRFVK